MRLLGIDEVSERASLSPETIYSRIAGGTFPKQVHLGPNKIGWYEPDIDVWIIKQRTINSGGLIAFTRGFDSALNIGANQPTLRVVPITKALIRTHGHTSESEFS